MNRGALGDDRPEGFLPLCKPPGMTSHDLTAWLKRTWGLKKAGHCGALDPLAVGVLVLCVNGAARWADRVSGSVKRYRAEIRFGTATDSGDAAGKPTRRTGGRVDRDALKSALKEFHGTILQTPPMTSAIKIGGKKLYKLARKGIEIERPAREIWIERIELLDFRKEKDGDRALIDVTCGKGTYLRTLAEDIGKALDRGAHLSFLARLEVGPFRLTESPTPRELARSGRLADALWPIDKTLEWLDAHAVR